MCAWVSSSSAASSLVGSLHTAWYADGSDSAVATDKGRWRLCRFVRVTRESPMPPCRTTALSSITAANGRQLNTACTDVKMKSPMAVAVVSIAAGDAVVALLRRVVATTVEDAAAAAASTSLPWQDCSTTRRWCKTAATAFAHADLNPRPPASSTATFCSMNSWLPRSRYTLSGYITLNDNNNSTVSS